MSTKTASKGPSVGSKRKRPADFDNDEPAAHAVIVDDGEKPPKTAAAASSGVVAAAVTSVPEAKAVASSGAAALRGVSKSNRSWKPVQTKRFSAMTRPKAQGSKKKGVQSMAFKLQQTEKAARKAAKELHDRLKEAKEQEKKDRIEKMMEKRRRKAENEFKSAVVQEISDPTKLKRMSKKQLRQIKRVRVNDDGIKELAPAYS